jgi:hypothetical protein
MKWLRAFGLGSGLLMAIALAAAPARAGSEETIKAFASWQGRGQMFETGPARATFVGSFTGMVFVDTEKGPLDAGFMVCPAILDINLTEGTQEGKGRCTITGKDVLGGAARGAALGAVGGAIGGDAGKGAAIGAGVGATAGLMRRNQQRRQQAQVNQQAAAQYQADVGHYNQAFAVCMQGRGYAVR